MSELPENAVEIMPSDSQWYDKYFKDNHGPGKLVWLKDDPPEPTLAAKINNKFPPPSGYRWQHVIDEFGLVDRGEYQLYADQRDRMVDERNAARMDQAFAITKLAKATKLRPLDEEAVEKYLRQNWADHVNRPEQVADWLCAEFGNPPMPTQEQVVDAMGIHAYDVNLKRLAALGILPAADQEVSDG